MTRYIVDPIPHAAVVAPMRLATTAEALLVYEEETADLADWLDHCNQLAVDRFEVLRRVQAIIVKAQAAAALANPST